MFNLDFGLFILRWLHTFAGIVWIGHLYYINFVQGPFMGEADAPVKAQATLKLVPRVLWWFRWGAFWTAALGLVYLGIQGSRIGIGVESMGYWVRILTGSTLGLIMAANVWFVIWPAQKVVIASAQKVAGGGTADPTAAGRAARGLVASRTNVLFSIPMLFFMGAAQHWQFGAKEGSAGTYALVAGLLIVLLEANALKGKTGPMTTVKGVITCGFALTVVFALLVSMIVAI
jgi:uncharacterized membrane protein